MVKFLLNVLAAVLAAVPAALIIRWLTVSTGLPLRNGPFLRGDKLSSQNSGDLPQGRGVLVAQTGPPLL